MVSTLLGCGNHPVFFVAIAHFFCCIDFNSQGLKLLGQFVGNVVMMNVKLLQKLDKRAGQQCFRSIVANGPARQVERFESLQDL